MTGRARVNRVRAWIVPPGYSRVRVLQALFLVIIAFQLYDQNWEAVLGWVGALIASRPGGIWRAAR